MITITLFNISISSYTGQFMQEITVEADDINKALEIGNEFAEHIDGEVSSITKSYKTCVKSSTKTITIEV